jgi:two-component system, NtrC family, response regulator AtoC
MGSVRTLVVDDDDLTRELLAHVLRKEGHEVVEAGDGAEALTRLGAERFDLIVSDVQMARTSGLELLEAIAKMEDQPPVILVTAYAEPGAAMDAMFHGAADYLSKPVDVLALRSTAVRALERRRLQQENRALARETLGRRHILGTSVPVLELYKQVAQVAPTNATVLIQGESGSGKELVARTIHERSRRASGPFLAVNCAALTESLLESELFGHAKGAFTGANATRRGMFEEASDGTLFLDEIGDISPKMQAQLLRVLQEGEVRRVGGNEPISVDVRVVSASNRDLAVEVAANRMRADLFYRLNVVTLKVPPLRERGDDILILARHFAARHALDVGRPTPELSDETIVLLQAHPWPGNVRELENAMARAVAMCQRNVVLPTDLPATVGAPAEPTGHQCIDSDWPTIVQLDRRYMAKVLRRAEGNKTNAAAILGIDRRTLQRLEHDSAAEPEPSEQARKPG